MKIIEISAAEKRQGALGDAALEAAKTAVFDEGFVALVGAISDEACDRLYEQMVAEYDWLQATFGPLPVRGSGNFEGARYHGHSPRPAAPWVSREMSCNPYAIQVTTGLMGDGVHVGNFNANWSLPPQPGETPARQGVHGDAGPLFPHYGWTPPFILNLSIPLVDFTEANGATEIWRYTHKLDPAINEHPSREARDAAMEAQRAICPPERMVAPKGTVVIRDPRAWHAGMPNTTTKPRIMIAQRHYVFWMRNCRPHVGDRLNERRQPVEAGSEEVFRDETLIWRTETIPAGSTDYLYDSLKQALPELTREQFDARAAQAPPPELVLA